MAGIANSGSVFTILSPPGTGPDCSVCTFESLELEAALGITATAVPEPNSFIDARDRWLDRLNEATKAIASADYSFRVHDSSALKRRPSFFLFKR